MRAAVLTVSDSVHQGTRTDMSGPSVAEALTKASWQVAGVTVLPDDRALLGRWLADTADRGEVDAIFSTGGTGVAARDVTPEATREVLDREIPGIGELMRLEGRKSTPLAVLSRGLAGTRKQTLIVNLPGSPKGAVESLAAVLPIASHVIALLRGQTEHPVK
jgi:molybdopterin adenylyltransferase